MPTNDFLQIAKSVGANVATQANYAANAGLQNNGFSSGVVDSPTFNKALRQSSFVSAMLGKFINDYGLVDALDDGDLATFESRFLAAINGSPGVTAAQFDNSTKRATTAFIQRALGNRQAYMQVSTNTQLTVADLGKLIVLTAGVQVTLPAVATCPSGTGFRILSTVSGASVVCPGAEKITAGSSLVGALSLKVGDSVDLDSTAAAWYASGGSGAFPYAAGFAYSLNNPGYFKLPSGWIVQCGSQVFSANSTTTVALPTSFPIYFAGVLTCVRDNVATPTANPFGAAVPIDLSSFSHRAYYTASTIVHNWIAVGY